jgi:hypothetical protein
MVILDEFDMVSIATAYPLWQQHDGESWSGESAVIKLLGTFIISLPSE